MNRRRTEILIRGSKELAEKLAEEIEQKLNYSWQAVFTIMSEK